jgi:hypothetical protein
VTNCVLKKIKSFHRRFPFSLLLATKLIAHPITMHHISLVYSCWSSLFLNILDLVQCSKLVCVTAYGLDTQKCPQKFGWLKHSVRSCVICGMGSRDIVSCLQYLFRYTALKVMRCSSNQQIILLWWLTDIYYYNCIRFVVDFITFMRRGIFKSYKLKTCWFITLCCHTSGYLAQSVRINK